MRSNRSRDTKKKGIRAIIHGRRTFLFLLVLPSKKREKGLKPSCGEGPARQTIQAGSRWVRRLADQVAIGCARSMNRRLGHVLGMGGRRVQEWLRFDLGKSKCQGRPFFLFLLLLFFLFFNHVILIIFVK
jgi:hypothetical protein